MKAQYTCGSVVWTRVATNWWPGVVTTSEKCPIEYIQGRKKEPLLIVKFFNEQEFFDVHRQDSVISYTSTRRQDLIKKGINALKQDETLLQKFEADVKMAEKLTGGNLDILDELKSIGKRKIDYSDMGFGPTKSKRPQKYESLQKEGFSNIGEAIQYKKGTSVQPRYVKIDYNSKILEQPKTQGDMKSESNWYKCYKCGYTCLRLNVIIWHIKNHLRAVADYDSGIKIPGKRKRKQATPSRNQKNKIPKKSINQHIHTNGHASVEENGHKAEELLLDWQDDDEDEISSSPQPSQEVVQVHLNGYKGESEVDEKETPASPPKLPAQRDMNSAFDALLAETSTNLTSISGQAANYVCNNDSDSDCSDWEKYYDKDSDENNSPLAEKVPTIDGSDDYDAQRVNGLYEKPLDNTQNATVPCIENSSLGTSNRPLTNDPPTGSTTTNAEEYRSPSPKQVVESSTDIMTRYESSTEMDCTEETIPCDSTYKIALEESSTTKFSNCTEEVSYTDDQTEKSDRDETNPRAHSTNTDEEVVVCAKSALELATSVHSKSTEETFVCARNAAEVPSISAQSKGTGHSLRNVREDAIESAVSPVKKGTSKESKSSSAPAYMLVAVDAQGNNVPMPVLSEGGGHLMAVEASMEDGSTRTLYIDPAHLGPNVDLNNLMLHIDNSGQETVIIPTETEQEEVLGHTNK